MMSGQLESIDQEFADFIKFCKKQKFTASEMKVIFEPLNKQIRYAKFKKIFILLITSCLIVYLCTSVETFAWILSAIGRLLMIKILPIWDWSTWYNAKCLIARSNSQIDTFISAANKYETDSKNCILCERFDQIDVLENITFSYIQRNYLEKGLPVLISDSHESQLFDGFLKNMKNVQKFIESDPCDVETNLMLSKLVNIEDLIIAITEQDSNSLWFFQIRNCQFHAVKDSRRFIRKPYYYSAHLEPFYSSWVLMSKDFQNNRKELYLDGLIIAQQITGNLLVTLSSKEPCKEICGEHSFILNEGDGLVFVTDLWIFSYTLDNFGESVTVITETHWN